MSLTHGWPQSGIRVIIYIGERHLEMERKAFTAARWFPDISISGRLWPTRLTVNMAAVAAANTVHWTVPQNLLKNPEAQAHLWEHRISVSILAPVDNKHTHRRVQPEHGGDQLPGEWEDTKPDAGNSDGLQKLVKLVVGEFWTGHNRDKLG